VAVSMLQTGDGYFANF